MVCLPKKPSDPRTNINKNRKKNNYIEGDYEDISDDNDKKLWNSI